MVEEGEMPEMKCDPEDIVCQMQVLGHLKGLRGVLGEEQFKLDFPELDILDDKIKSREADLKEALERCGLPSIGEPEAEIKMEEKNIEQP